MQSNIFWRAIRTQKHVEMKQFPQKAAWYKKTVTKTLKIAPRTRFVQDLFNMVLAHRLKLSVISLKQILNSTDQA